MSKRRQRTTSVEDLKSLGKSSDNRGVQLVTISKLVSELEQVKDTDIYKENVRIFIINPKNPEKEIECQTLNITNSKGEKGSGDGFFQALELLTGATKIVNKETGEFSGGAILAEGAGTLPKYNFETKEMDEEPCDIYSNVIGTIGACFNYYYKVKDSWFNGYTGEKVDWQSMTQSERENFFKSPDAYMYIKLPDYAYHQGGYEAWDAENRSNGFNKRIQKKYRIEHPLHPETFQTMKEMLEDKKAKTAYDWEDNLKEIDPNFHYTNEQLDEKRMERLKNNIERHNKVEGAVQVEFDENEFVKFAEIGEAEDDDMAW